jgi:aryl-alcohol dehydrogenase-like predicted oxidoreductase
MEPESPRGTTTRRGFVGLLAGLAVGGRTLFETRDAGAAVHAARQASGAAGDWPEMPRRTLGRTGFEGSRLIFGCGASLMFRARDALLNAAYDAGVNVFDVGFASYYRNAEANLAPFVGKVRDEIFLISKAIAEVDGLGDHDRVTPAQAKAAARGWLEQLDQSLATLKVDHVDAYYQMAAYNPSLVTSDEMFRAFETAKQSGKTRFLGLSTHRNAEAVLRAAIASGRFDLAMIGITPAGWYDWENKAVLAGSKTMAELRPLLDEARAAGIGLIGMKAARHLDGLPLLGWWKKPGAFDEHYGEGLENADLSPYQKTYAFVLEHGVDAVNADMSELLHLRENALAAATSKTYFV